MEQKEVKNYIVEIWTPDHMERAEQRLSNLTPEALEAQIQKIKSHYPASWIFLLREDIERLKNED